MRDSTLDVILNNLHLPLPPLGNFLLVTFAVGLGLDVGGIQGEYILNIYAPTRLLSDQSNFVCELNI